MKVTFAKSEITTSVEARNTLVSIIADAKNGGFMRINGFIAKGGYGEVQNTTYCKGISYGNAIKNSLAILEEIENDADFTISVTRGVWKDENGNISPTNRKNKIFTISDTVRETYAIGSQEMTDALAKVRKGLENPRPTKDYKKLGNGIYVDESTDALYLRDLRLVSKAVVTKGEYPFKASGAVTSLKSAIERTMPIGQYRQFRLDADYTSIALGGIELAQDAQAMSGKTAQGKTATATTQTQTQTQTQTVTN